MRTYEIRRETVVPRDRRELFAFFSEAGNLEELTPDWLRFEVVSEPVEMRRGARIDYRLKLRGVPVRWTSEITLWEPPERFVDEQVRGPYRRWRHEHRFEERPGATAVFDHVRYAVPGGPFLERPVQRFLVGPDVERIFDHRQRRLEELFGP
ncbi:MAG: SRPBCC family protein [Acidobacteriota bacterium]